MGPPCHYLPCNQEPHNRLDVAFVLGMSVTDCFNRLNINLNLLGCGLGVLMGMMWVL